MKNELKQKWLEALLSDKYQQGQNHLRNEDNEFCCLGVLCDILAPDNWVGPDNTLFNEPITTEGYQHQEITDSLSCALLKEIGLTTEQESILIQMNDGGREYERNPQTFKQIANWIQENI